MRNLLLLAPLAFAACDSGDVADPRTGAPPPLPAPEPQASVLEWPVGQAMVPRDHEPAELPPSFEPAVTHVPDGRLCSYLDGDDPVHLPCDIEIDNTIAPAGVAPSELRVVAWNVRFGVDGETVLNELVSNAELQADVLLLSEVARGDSRSNPAGAHQARDIAHALGMNYAFGVEWDHRLVADYAEPKGEHGVAVLARFPLGDLSAIRHTPAHDFFSDQRRLGGRTSLGATLLVGDDLVRVYASHFCTRPSLPNDGPRALQGDETRADVDSHARAAIEIVGGDFNTWTCNPAQGDCSEAPRSEQVIDDFFAAGWRDGTAGFTGYTHLGEGFFPQRLDWIFYRGADVTPGARIDAGGSDHLPIATTLRF